MSTGRFIIENGTRREMTQQEVDALPVAVTPIPQVVSMAQARITLRRATLLASVNTLIAAADAETQDAWEYATELRRDSPLVLTLAGALNLTSQQVDDLFTAAAAVVL